MTPSSGEVVRIPRVSTPLVGRAQERAAINEVLADPSLQLMTLTGPGGVGKTRLAIQCALDVAGQFNDGVTFVYLAGIRDEDEAILAIVEALELSLSGNRPVFDVLKETLSNRQLLLVLDNVEMLVSSGPAIAELLVSSPGLTILATGRSPLNIRHEREYEIQPLPLPEPAARREWREVEASDAVALFVQRARAVRPDFTLTEDTAPDVAEICRRLDGLPLAIELAAVRSKNLNPRALLSRLANSLNLLADGPRDAPSRLRTMHGATAWSHDLLVEEERVFFRRLAVFRGSFTLAAAAAVALEPGNDSELLALDRIESLVDKSLLRQVDGRGDEPRFLMLQTIREFALARLVEAGEEVAVRDGHANWCLAMVEAAEPHLHRAEQLEWLGRLVNEQPNLREALAWTRETSLEDRFPRMVSSLWSLWFNVGSLQEGSHWLDEAVAHINGVRPEISVRVLCGAGLIAMAQCAFAKSAALLDRASPMVGALAGHRWQGIINFGLGVIEQDEGRPEQAKQRFEAALAAFQSGDEGEFWAGIATNNLGLVTSRLGDHEEGRRLLSQGLALHRRNGYAFGTALSLRFLGQVNRDAGDFAEAERCFEASLEIDVTRTQQWHVASSLEGLGEVAAKHRNAAHAARLLGAASQIRAEIGVPLEPAVRSRVDRLTDTVRIALGEEAFGREWKHGQRLPVSELITSNGADAPVKRESKSADRTPAILSAREIEILRLVAAGRSSKEIAEAVYISPRTVTTHISNIFAKLDVHDRGAAIAQAYQRGILSSTDSEARNGTPA